MQKNLPWSKGRRFAWKTQRSKRGLEDPGALGPPRIANEKGSKEGNKMRMNVGPARKGTAVLPPKGSVPSYEPGGKLVWVFSFGFVLFHLQNERPSCLFALVSFDVEWRWNTRRLLVLQASSSLVCAIGDDWYVQYMMSMSLDTVARRIALPFEDFSLATSSRSAGGSVLFSTASTAVRWIGRKRFIKVHA